MTTSTEDFQTSNSSSVKIGVNSENKCIADTSKTDVTLARNNVQLLGPAILNALHFQPDKANDEEIRGYVTYLQNLLGRTVKLLKEQDCICAILEKQNSSLTLQKNSLRDIVHVIKNLINTKVSEVAYLHEQINALHGKIDFERQRHALLTGVADRSSQEHQEADSLPSDNQYVKDSEEKDKRCSNIQNDEFSEQSGTKVPLVKGIGDLAELQ